MGADLSQSNNDRKQIGSLKVRGGRGGQITVMEELPQLMAKAPVKEIMNELIPRRNY